MRLWDWLHDRVRPLTADQLAERRETRLWEEAGLQPRRNSGLALRSFPNDPPAVAMRRWRLRYFGIKEN